LLGTRKREHSRKPDEQYEIIEACSPGPFVELFARGTRAGWIARGGLHLGAMEFWSNDFGKSRGIWDDDTKGDSTDLWADVSPLLKDIESFQTKHELDKQTFFRSGTELSSAIVGLAGFERVALWSVMHSN
jgi:MT-A70 protein